MTTEFTYRNYHCRVWYDQGWKWRADGNDRCHWKVGYGTKNCAKSAAESFIDAKLKELELIAVDNWLNELWPDELKKY